LRQKRLVMMQLGRWFRKRLFIYTKYPTELDV
jgi:hypothetical protein